LGMNRQLDREEAIDEWSDAAEVGTLLTPKHDSNNVTDMVLSQYRSVCSLEVSGSLKEFIDSKDYDIYRYDDTKYPMGAGLYEVIPRDSSRFTDLGAGVPPLSTETMGSMDRLAFVSGSNLGWHFYAIDSSTLSDWEKNGRLNSKTSL
jgi:hypothetical protein